MNQRHQCRVVCSETHESLSGGTASAHTFNVANQTTCNGVHYYSCRPVLCVSNATSLYLRMIPTHAFGPMQFRKTEFDVMPPVCLIDNPLALCNRGYMQ